MHYRNTRRRREREREKTCFEKVIAENFPNLGKAIVSQAMEVHRSPNTRDPRKTTARYILIKMRKIKDKDRLLKAARGRNNHIQRKAHQANIRLLSRNLTGQKGVA